MKILVIGGGGREHALVWKIAQSPKVEKIYCAPGNAGIAEIAECVDLKVEDLDGLAAFAKGNGVDLTVVGPEVPLTMGVVDRFEKENLRIFGPQKNAALIEGSKEFSKEIMVKYGVPTAAYGSFTDAESALKYIEEVGAPIVVKADGLAAGKGVVVAMDVDTAKQAVNDIMGDQVFGSAGSKVVIEEFLDGEEVSVLAFSDGKTVVPMVSAQDHKRAYDNDEGPNTGGMGAYSPAPIYTAEMEEFVVEKVLKPTVNGMAAEGRTYKGVLYAGLMVTKDGIKVLEFNARFGDPETQAVLMRLDSDLVEIMEAVIDGRLAEQEIKWHNKPAVCVVVAAGGYPKTYRKGDEITGLTAANDKAVVFHAGTKLADGKVVSHGGRVLGVTAMGDDIRSAINNAYEAVDKIHFADCFCRRDIGHRAIK
ncbi:MAG: phosphoribosylamine--glycine ligase [Bacillota bacterium]|jgi:phosphoribosylamine--glycine ligase